MKPILCRPGGKKLLAKEILKNIPNHKVYVEPFVGTGRIFFTKNPAKKNVLGDNDKELIRFYKDVQSKQRLTCNLTTSKKKFERAKKKKVKSPCDYARVTLASFACAGKYYSKQDRKVKGKVKLDNQIQRLKKAKLTSKDFKETIKKYDSPDTFFYLDPPYHDKSCEYPRGSCDVKPEDVANAVKKIKGKFLLSYNDHPKVRKTFCKKYSCKRVQTKYSANKNKGKQQEARKELLIKNY